MLFKNYFLVTDYKKFDIQLAHSMLDIDNFILPDNITKCKNTLKEIQQTTKEMEKDPNSLCIINLEAEMEAALSIGDKKKARALSLR